MRCFICDSENLSLFLSLGHQPPSDAFLRKEDLTKPETSYPLDVYFCGQCGLVQLGYAVDPEILFRDYVYSSGTNNILKKHFKDFVDALVKAYELSSASLAVDVGSNDGSLLENYTSHHVRILGIDPSSVTSIAIAKGQPTIVDFFCEETALRAVHEYGQAQIITATNVFAHVKDLQSFMRGIRALLAPGGVFVSESGYTADLVEQLQYDFIYHEHLRYYTLGPLRKLFEMHDMEIIDAERISIHGGSIRVHAAIKGTRSISPRVAELIDKEKSLGLYNLSTYSSFAQRVRDVKHQLQQMLLAEAGARKKIIGIGAPAKGNTLLNYCKIDADIVSYLVEKSDLKIGKYTPGMHIPVIEENPEHVTSADCALLLSWTIADELMPKLRAKGYNGTFIIPAPTPRIVT